MTRPRGLRFLYDLHRMNVAVSRARALSVVVAEPRALACFGPDSEHMRLANALCRYAELATGMVSDGPARRRCCNDARRAHVAGTVGVRPAGRR